MAFIDALQDRVTIYSISISTSAEGEQTKQESLLYSNIRCGLRSISGFREIQPDPGAMETYSERWLIQVEAQYNGADRGDKAVVNGITYQITKKHEIKGVKSTAEYIVYYLQEKE